MAESRPASDAAYLHRLGHFLRGFTIWHFNRFGGDFGLNATRWFFLTNHGYPGEQHRYYVRIGRWPGWARSFGGRRV